MKGLEKKKVIKRAVHSIPYREQTNFTQLFATLLYYGFTKIVVYI